MSYEFAESDSTQGLIPSVPEFWHAQDRIYKLVPGYLGFVGCQSIIEDDNDAKRHIGIDTNDLLHGPDRVAFKTDPSIGVLRLMLDEPEVNGFIVDLRYTTRLPRRALNFGLKPGEEPIDDDGSNERHKAEPVLGAIFTDPESGKLLFMSEYELQLRPFAASLAKQVDYERRVRGESPNQERPKLEPEFSADSTQRNS